MILAAADVITTYIEPPHKLARLVDILFVIAFAIQGAIWARELILGVIGHKVAWKRAAAERSPAPWRSSGC